MSLFLSLVCDNCLTSFDSTNEHTKRSARASAKHQGWKTNEKTNIDICPDCVKDPKWLTNR